MNTCLVLSRIFLSFCVINLHIPTVFTTLHPQCLKYESTISVTMFKDAHEAQAALSQTNMLGFFVFVFAGFVKKKKKSRIKPALIFKYDI